MCDHGCWSKMALHWLCQQLSVFWYYGKLYPSWCMLHQPQRFFCVRGLAVVLMKLHMWSVPKRAAPMFIWHAHGSSVIMMEDGHGSDTIGSVNSLLICSFPIREYRILVENKKFLWNLFWLHENGLDGFLIFKNSGGGFLEVVETSSVSSFNVKTVLWNNYSDRS